MGRGHLGVGQAPDRGERGPGVSPARGELVAGGVGGGAGLSQHTPGDHGREEGRRHALHAQGAADDAGQPVRGPEFARAHGIRLAVTARGVHTGERHLGQRAEHLRAQTGAVIGGLRQHPAQAARRLRVPPVHVPEQRDVRDQTLGRLGVAVGERTVDRGDDVGARGGQPVHRQQLRTRPQLGVCTGHERRRSRRGGPGARRRSRRRRPAGRRRSPARSAAAGTARRRRRPGSGPPGPPAARPRPTGSADHCRRRPPPPRGRTSPRTPRADAAEHAPAQPAGHGSRSSRRRGSGGVARRCAIPRRAGRAAARCRRGCAPGTAPGCGPRPARSPGGARPDGNRSRRRYSRWPRRARSRAGPPGPARRTAARPRGRRLLAISASGSMTSSGSTRKATSPAAPSGSRLVTSRPSRGHGRPALPRVRRRRPGRARSCRAPAGRPGRRGSAVRRVSGSRPRASRPRAVSTSLTSEVPGERGELDPPDAVVEPGGQLGGAERQPGLAGAAGADQRHEPVHASSAPARSAGCGCGRRKGGLARQVAEPGVRRRERRGTRPAGRGARAGARARAGPCL